MSHAVETQALHAGYGGVQVVHDLAIHADAGEIVALLGANGAGKTTTLLTIAGALPALGGQVMMADRVAPRSLTGRARAGMALVTDDRGVLRGLTVQENLRLAGVDPAAVTKVFPALERLMGRKAGLLSGGEQQMLGLGQALARNPKVLLADELSLGLAPIVVRSLLAAVRDAADQGMAIILVEQQVRLVLDVCDRAYVLQRGRVQMAGTAAELRGRRAEIEQAYLSATV
ncbi:MAG TPA: ATP-binding cassette domain-containing protein [Trebonia sp.]|nr:ATP-binding cassette domain-containing protein [Trebonia sp.]